MEDRREDESREKETGTCTLPVGQGEAYTFRLRRVAEALLDGARQVDALQAGGFSPHSTSVLKGSRFRYQLKIAQTLKETDCAQHRGEILHETLAIARNKAEKSTVRLRALAMLGKWAGLDRPKPQDGDSSVAKSLEEHFRTVVATVDSGHNGKD